MIFFLTYWYWYLYLRVKLYLRHVLPLDIQLGTLLLRNIFVKAS